MTRLTKLGLAGLAYAVYVLLLIFDFRPWEDSIRPPVAGHEFTPTWALIVFPPLIVFGAFLLLREALEAVEAKLKYDRENPISNQQQERSNDRYQ